MAAAAFNDSTPGAIEIFLQSNALRLEGNPGPSTPGTSPNFAGHGLAEISAPSADRVISGIDTPSNLSMEGPRSSGV